jgi:hypothetical protein
MARPPDARGASGAGRRPAACSGRAEWRHGWTWEGRRLGAGRLGSSIGGLFDSVGRAIGGAFQGAATAALSTGPLILIVGAALAFFAVVFLWRALR